MKERILEPFYFLSLSCLWHARKRDKTHDSKALSDEINALGGHHCTCRNDALQLPGEMYLLNSFDTIGMCHLGEVSLPRRADAAEQSRGFTTLLVVCLSYKCKAHCPFCHLVCHVYSATNGLYIFREGYLASHSGTKLLQLISIKIHLARCSDHIRRITELKGDSVAKRDAWNLGESFSEP